jgi:transcriptional regulator, lacI family
MDRFVERFQLHASARLEEENLHLVSIPVRIGEEQQIVNALSCGLYDSACLACNPTSAEALMDLLPTPPIPTMIFGTLPPMPSYIGVTIDETAGITQALSGLVNGGAKKIAYLTQRRNAEELENEPRWHAYMKFLSDSQLGAPEVLAYTEGSIPSAFQCATTIFTGREELPDAVYCDSDRVAIGAVLAATQCVIAIPDDLQIIGTGASVDGGDLHPALSTIGLDNQDLDSAVTLLSTLSGEEPESTTLTLRWHYMPRGTTH